MPTRIHPRKGIPGSAAQAAEPAATCVAAQSGRHLTAKDSGRVRKVTDNVTTYAPTVGQSDRWARWTSPQAGEVPASPISSRAAHRLPNTSQRPCAGGHQYQPPAGVPVSVTARFSWRSTSCRRGTMPASAKVSNARRSGPSNSTLPGGAPSSTVMTQSRQAPPRTSHRSQSTIMSGSISLVTWVLLVIWSLRTVDRDPDNLGPISGARLSRSTDSPVAQGMKTGVIRSGESP
jgi:hypothetical protein